MRLARLVVAASAAALLVAATPQASAGGAKLYEDKQRGFRLHVGEKYEQLPPKLTADESYVVGDWYADAAKYDGGFQRPEFKVFWFATPKAAVVTPGAGDKPGADAFGKVAEGGSVDDALDKFFGGVADYFGGSPPSAGSLWKNAKKVSTKTPGLDALYAGVNDPDDKKSAKKKDKPKDKAKDKNRGQDDPEEAPPPEDAYAMVAKLTLDRPRETIEVGFLGYCGYGFVKDGKKAFLEIVKSFEDMAKTATDSRNAGAQDELDENDPEKFRAAIKKSKLVPGWASVDTPHYVIVYPDKDVDAAMVKDIAVRIEALRTQVYETVFPADRPIKAISVIRCCKDLQQYMAYGGPGGTAGYWYSYGKELVFYEDRGAKKDSLRVLYHEGFHQYIYYSVGEVDPHSWFNEGNGDYFYGFNFEGGKWTRAIAQDRRDDAARAKREHKFPALPDWLRWSQEQYYGTNEAHLSGLDNYALGWDFIYFLRTTKKPQYQGVLQRYFDTLKGCVTKSRRALEPPPDKPAPSDGKDGGDPAAPAKPAPEPPRAEPPSYGGGSWLDQALEAAFKGVDMKQLEKDWLDTKPE